MSRPVHNHLPIVIKYTINIQILFKKMFSKCSPPHPKKSATKSFSRHSKRFVPGRPWTPLDAPGRPWTPLDAPGRPWTPLDAPGRPWTPLNAPGRLWTPLDAPGRPWTPLDAPGRPWTPLDAPVSKYYFYKFSLNFHHPPSQKVLQNLFQVILSYLSLDAPVRPCTPLRPCVKTRFA